MSMDGNGLVEWMTKPPKWVKRMTIAFLLMIVVLAGVLWISDQIVAAQAEGYVYSSLDDLPNKPVAVVLGTSPVLKNGRVNLFYSRRLAAACELYEAGIVRGIIVSGDNGTDEYDEPGQMKADLIKAGIPEAYITCDYAGFRTLDTVVRAQSVFEQSSYILVSQSDHLKRAVMIARYHGADAIGYSAKAVGGVGGAKVRLREMFARTKALLDCWTGKEPKFYGQPEPVGMRPGLSHLEEAKLEQLNRP